MRCADLMVSDPHAEDDDLKYKSAPLDNFYTYNAVDDPYNQSRGAVAGELITEDFCKFLESYKKIADDGYVFILLRELGRLHGSELV